MHRTPHRRGVPSAPRAPNTRLRAAVLALLAVGSMACGRADASAPRTAGAPAAQGTATTAAPASARPAAAADTLSDSALVMRADRGRTKGNDGAMWVVMISDFQCPYCKQWHDSSMARLEKDYITPGRVRFAYLHLPLTSIHPHARAQAEASMCAAVQDKFWPYTEAMFEAQQEVRTLTDVSPVLKRVARELQLDSAAFAACRASRAIRQLVDNDMAQASQAGVQSTPSFIVGDFLVQGAMPYPEFRKAIDTALVVARTRRPR